MFRTEHEQQTFDQLNFCEVLCGYLLFIVVKISQNWLIINDLNPFSLIN